MNTYEVKPVDPAQLDALVRAARAERGRQINDGIVCGAKAVAKFFRLVASAVSEAYEAERQRTTANASASMRRWASGD